MSKTAITNNWSTRSPTWCWRSSAVTTYCPTFCHADVQRIVDAGAERIGIVLGETATAHDWASLIDHTLLKPEASESDIKKLCDEAVEFGFASVCVNPGWVKKAAEFLKGSGFRFARLSDFLWVRRFRT